MDFFSNRWERVKKRVSQALIASMLVEILAPAAVLAQPTPPPVSSARPVRASHSTTHASVPMDPQLAKVLRQVRHPAPELPGDSQGLEAWFPEGNSPDPGLLAQVETTPTPSPDREEEPSPSQDQEETPVPETTATPAPRRYPVTPENLRAREEKRRAEEASCSQAEEESPEEHHSSHHHRGHHQDQPDESEHEACPPRPAPASPLAYLLVDPLAPAPSDEWSRQTSESGRYYPLVDGNSAYQCDELVHLARDYKDLAPNEEIRWDWTSPAAEENITSLGTAASVRWNLRRVGLSPSALDSKYTMECRVYDRRHKTGQLVFSRTEPMHLCEVRLHAALAARTVGDWTLSTRRNGQVAAPETLKVLELPAATEAWSRYRIGDFKAAADKIFYVNDEFATHQKTYPIPAPDAQGQQSYQVTWDWLAPAEEASLNATQRNTFSTMETTYVSDGTTYSVVSKVFDPSYPAGKVLSTRTGSGRLSQLEVHQARGLPVYGTWQLRESLTSGSATTTSLENLAVREIRTAVSTATPTLPVGGTHHTETGSGHESIAIPFHLKVETFPSTWTPGKLNWELNLSGSNGQKRQYKGSIEEAGQSSHSAVQIWNGDDDTGAKFALGVEVDPVLLVTIPETPAATALRTSALSLADADAAPHECTYLPDYVRVSFCTLSSGCSPQIIHNNDTVTYTITHIRTPFPSLGVVGALCLPSRFFCPQAISCKVNGVPAIYGGGGIFYLPQAVTEIYGNPADMVSTQFTMTAVFQMADNLVHDCWPDGLVNTGSGNGPVVGCLGNGWWDYYPVNFAGEGPPTDDHVTNDLEAGGKDPKKDKDDKKKTEKTCGCDCPPNETTVNSPLALDLSPGSGQYSRSEVDLGVPTRGFPLVLARENHSRQTAAEQPNGWSWTFQDSLVVDSAAKILHHRSPDGETDTFSMEQGVLVPTRPDQTDVITPLDARHFERLTKGHTRFLYEVPAGVSMTGPDPAVAVLTKITDPNGNANTFTWDSLGQKLTRMEGPVPGQFLQLSWTAGHNGPLLQGAADQTGRKVTYRYCAYKNPLSASGWDDLLTEVVQPGDRQLTYRYHPVLGKHRYVLLTSRLNGVLQEKSVECDDNPGVLLEATHRLEATLKFERTLGSDGSATSQITRTAPQGMPGNQDQVWAYEMHDDMVTQTRDPLGNVMKYGYDDNHNLARVETPRGAVSTSVFDLRKNLISSTDHLNRTTRLSYDNRDRLLTVTDVNGGVTRMSWDAQDNLVSVTDPAGHTSTITRNGFGQVLSSTDALGHPGNLIAYDAFGFPSTITQPAATPGGPTATTHLDNDSLGRPLRVQDALGRVSRMRWSERGHLIEATLPAVTAQGAQEALKEARIRRVFDENDLLRESVAPDGLKTVYDYDSAHHLTSVLPPGTSRPTLLEYDAMENVVKMTNSNGQSTLYGFDALNRNVSLQYPGGDSESYQFDADSNLVAWDRGAYTVSYSYDLLSRLTAIDSPTTNDHIGLNYDSLDRVASMSDATGTTSYHYTQNYLLDQVVHPTGSIGYSYDEADRLTSLNADGDTTAYRYDDRDRLVQATLDGQSVSYGHDNLNRPTLTSYSNGVTCQQAFDERDQLLSKRYLRGGTPLFSVKYAYNQVGQRKSEEKRTSNWTKVVKYAYNHRRELSHSYRRVNNGPTTETTYRYDDNHNRLSKNETLYTNNAADQLTSVKHPGQTLTYNAAGQAEKAGDFDLRYNYNDQIKSVVTPQHNAQYVYDGNGQRVQKTVDGVISKFLWAGGEIIKEYGPGGAARAQYLLGGGREAIKTNGQWNFYLTDGLGSTVMLADQMGHAVATYEYSDFGETTQLSGSPNVYNPFLYTGQELDRETGLYHLRARHYAPSMGRFLARDPIGYAGGSNLMAYCNGDPINFTDPSGLEGEEEAIAAGSQLPQLAKWLKDAFNWERAGQVVHGFVMAEELLVPTSYLTGQALDNVLAKYGNPKDYSGVTQEHHVFPREMRKKFEAAGMVGAEDIDNYVFDLAVEVHGPIHKGKGYGQGGPWNREWELFFEANKGKKICRKDIMAHKDLLMKKYGLDVHFKGVWKRWSGAPRSKFPAYVRKILRRKL